MKMNRKEHLSIEQMMELRKLGLDTSNASMVLLFYDNCENEIGWDVNNIGEDNYMYFDDAAGGYQRASPVLYEAESGYYDHSYRNDCGVFTINDLINVFKKMKLTDNLTCDLLTTPSLLNWLYLLLVKTLKKKNEE